MENTTLYINVHDFISVSDWPVIELVVVRLTTWEVEEKDGLVVSVAEYRRLLGDNTSSDERIVERLRFLQAFCRNTIKPALQTNAITKNRTP